MTEIERMKQGYIWEDDDENMALQAKCKTLVRKFNELPPEAMEEREALLHDIFGEVGEHVWYYNYEKSRHLYTYTTSLINKLFVLKYHKRILFVDFSL